MEWQERKDSGGEEYLVVELNFREITPEGIIQFLQAVVEPQRGDGGEYLQSNMGILLDPSRFVFLPRASVFLGEEGVLKIRYWGSSRNAGNSTDYFEVTPTGFGNVFDNLEYLSYSSHSGRSSLIFRRHWSDEYKDQWTVSGEATANTLKNLGILVVTEDDEAHP